MVCFGELLVDFFCEIAARDLSLFDLFTVEGELLLEIILGGLEEEEEQVG